VSASAASTSRGGANDMRATRRPAQVLRPRLQMAEQQAGWSCGAGLATAPWDRPVRLELHSPNNEETPCPRCSKPTTKARHESK
jgi:hypothetical protein